MRAHNHARVWCERCDYAWFGGITAHGLSVLGHCPRCGGQLHFNEEHAPQATDEDHLSTTDVQPWQVMGAPLRRDL